MDVKSVSDLSADKSGSDGWLARVGGLALGQEAACLDRSWPTCSV